MLEWIITSQESNLKLIHFLSQKLKDQYSARFIKNVIERNGCKINGKTERFASTILVQGDHVSLHIEQKTEAHLSKIEKQRILYEDDALFVYNKPAGISCDEKGILQLLHSYLPSLKLVHRLDKDTTGVLLLAKQAIVFEYLVDQFKQFKVTKRYQAIVDGCVNSSKGIIKNYLGKKKAFAGQTIWGAVSSSQGVYACTKWICLKKTKQASLLICVPQTGRTHQIRVHMAEMGHPILGDHQYGKDFQCLYHASRYLLHAEEIFFQHPVTKSHVSFMAPLPDDFMKAQETLFKG